VTRLATAALALLLAVPASGVERLAVIAVGDPPNGPDGDLAELAYQLRAACRDRAPSVEDPSSMRAKLLGQTSNATESELDRAYGGALVVYQNGEFESSLRTLGAIVDDLESLPDTDESYRQWKRALTRLAHSAIAAGDQKEVENAFGKLLRVEPGYTLDPDQFSPGFRKRFEEARTRVRALPRRKLTVAAVGPPGTVFVNGKPVGTTPLTVTLPTGRYRISGASGSLRVPSLWIDLEQEDRSVVLDFALASSLRMNAGPGLALAAPDRALGVVRAGAWLGVDKLVTVTRTDEGQAQFLVGSIYDVQRGALQREGSVRMVAGGVPSVNLYALAAFLLTGQSSREVKDLSREGGKRAPPPVASGPSEKPASPSPAPTQPPASATASPPPPRPTAQPAATVARDAAAPSKPQLEPRLTLKPTETSPVVPPAPAREPTPGGGGGHGWMGPVAIGSGVVAAGLLGFAIQQSNASKRAYSRAEDQFLPDRTFKDAQAQERWRSLRAEGAREHRTAVISGVSAVVLGAGAAVLGWNALRGKRPDQVAAITVEF
jgi:hypothetical protein